MEIAISYYFLFVRCRKFDAYKDIESLQSIDLIKDAYLVVLQKGFGYTKEFIKAIQSNYKFSGKVAQDFAKLVQIDTTFRTKTAEELLNSQEWNNLGVTATTLLQEAVSLGKGHMVKYLADHAHSKDM